MQKVQHRELDKGGKKKKNKQQEDLPSNPQVLEAFTLCRPAI